MIKCHLSRLLGEKKLKISDVARDTGINRGTITRLYQETAVRVEFDVLEKRCLYLDCDLCDLLELIQEDKKDALVKVENTEERYQNGPPCRI